MSEESDGFVIDDSSFEDLSGSVEFFRSYAGQIRQNLGRRQFDPRDTQPRWPIRGVLTQDVAAGESAQVALLSRGQARMQFKVDLYGLIFQNTPFKLVLNGVRGANSTTLFTTGVIDGANATAVVMANAIADTKALSLSEVSVAIGNKFQNDGLIRNSFTPSIPDPNDPTKTILQTISNTWLIAITKEAWKTYDYLELIPFDSTGTTKFSDYNNIVISRKTLEVWNGVYETVTDVLGISDVTPLRAGSIVACVDFSDVGYGILSAYERDFDISSDA